MPPEVVYCPVQMQARESEMLEAMNQPLPDEDEDL